VYAWLPQRNAWRSSWIWNRIQGSWKQLQGKVKAQWGLLTDDDVTTIKGSREMLEGKIQERGWFGDFRF